jgi:glycerol-3-phosphate dehydrogenase
VRDHRADGVQGLMTVIGVRYTTARATAERVVDRAGALVGRRLDPCRRATTPLAGGDIADIAVFLADAQQASGAVDARTLTRLARSYGTAYPRLVAFVERDASLARPLGATCPITRAEVLYALHAEMAMRLSDVMLRRTEAGSAAHPGRDALEAAGAIAAAERGWSEARTMAEIDDVEARYRTPVAYSE